MVFIKIFTILYGLLPFLYYLFYKDKASHEIRAFLPFLILVFVSSIYEFLFTTILKWNVNSWFIIYCFISFFIIYYFFKVIAFEDIFIFKAISIVLYFILMLILFLFFNSDDFFKISSGIDTYITVFIFIASIIWFKKVFQDLEYDNLWDSSYFYVVSGLILYYFGNLFLFLMAQLMYKNDNYSFKYYWLLNIILNLVLRTLLIVGIWKARVK